MKLPVRKAEERGGYRSEHQWVDFAFFSFFFFHIGGLPSPVTL